jgi:hypothetical protein
MPGQMQRALEQLLSCAGTVSHKTLRFLKNDDVAASTLKPEIEGIYRSLGGILPSIPHFKLSHWDMEFDGIAVELDESLHFNRYRAITLKSASYEHFPRFALDSYQRFCSEGEETCCKNGKRPRGKWTNDSCEKQFGKASQPGDLSGNGSPRWKQRAFYDFLKDLSPLLIDVRVVRVAVWDVLANVDRTKTVGEILAASARQPPAASGEGRSAALAALVKERVDG